MKGGWARRGRLRAMVGWRGASVAGGSLVPRVWGMLVYGWGAALRHKPSGVAGRVDPSRLCKRSLVLGVQVLRWLRAHDCEPPDVSALWTHLHRWDEDVIWHHAYTALATAPSGLHRRRDVRGFLRCVSALERGLGVLEARHNAVVLSRALLTQRRPHWVLTDDHAPGAPNMRLTALQLAVLCCGGGHAGGRDHESAHGVGTVDAVLAAAIPVRAATKRGGWGVRVTVRGTPFVTRWRVRVQAGRVQLRLPLMWEIVAHAAHDSRVHPGAQRFNAVDLAARYNRAAALRSLLHHMADVEHVRLALRVWGRRDPSYGSALPPVGAGKASLERGDAGASGRWRTYAQTPLQLACEANNVAVVRVLLYDTRTGTGQHKSKHRAPGTALRHKVHTHTHTHEHAHTH